ncbi:MAG: DUF1476 domain-containing protein [bacterium]
MTTFDERDNRFENEFAHDEELKFKIEARRDKLVGLWLAEKMGLTGDAASHYAREVIVSDLEEPGEEDVIRKLMADIKAKGLSLTERQVRDKMAELLSVAKQQIHDGV